MQKKYNDKEKLLNHEAKKIIFDFFEQGIFTRYTIITSILQKNKIGAVRFNGIYDECAENWKRSKDLVHEQNIIDATILGQNTGVTTRIERLCLLQTMVRKVVSDADSGRTKDNFFDPKTLANTEYERALTALEIARLRQIAKEIQVLICTIEGDVLPQKVGLTDKAVTINVNSLQNNILNKS